MSVFKVSGAQNRGASPMASKSLLAHGRGWGTWTSVIKL
jgi:hypothetical protein